MQLGEGGSFSSMEFMDRWVNLSLVKEMCVIKVR